MLDAVALAWASWAGLGVGILGTVVSLVGLTLTFREARRASRAARLAASEVAKVLALNRARTRLSALSSTVQQADSISLRIAHGSLSREQVTAFRRSVMEALAINSISAPDVASSADPIAEALERLASLLVNQVEWSTKQGQMHSELDKVTSFLIAQEARARTEDYR